MTTTNHADNHDFELPESDFEHEHEHAGHEGHSDELRDDHAEPHGLGIESPYHEDELVHEGEAATEPAVRTKTGRMTLLLAGVAAVVVVAGGYFEVWPRLHPAAPTLPVSAVHQARITPGFSGIQNRFQPVEKPTLPSPVSMHSTLPSVSEPVAKAPAPESGPSSTASSPVTVPTVLPVVNEPVAKAPEAASPPADAVQTRLADALIQLANTMHNIDAGVQASRSDIQQARSSLLQRIDQTDDSVKAVGTRVDAIASGQSALNTRVDIIERKLHLSHGGGDTQPAKPVAANSHSTEAHVEPRHTGGHHLRHHPLHDAVPAASSAPDDANPDGAPNNGAGVSGYRLRGVSRTEALVETAPGVIVPLKLGQPATDGSGKPIPGIGRVLSIDHTAGGWELKTDGGIIN